MDMEYKNLRMVIIIKVNIKRENSMEKENIVGLMDHPTKEILYKDIDMGKEIGNLQGKVVIYIREDIKTIKNVVMVAMCGQMVVFIKDTLKTILSNFIII
jgi:aminopeptidase C